VYCGDDCKGCPIHGPLCQACGSGPTKEFGVYHVCKDCFWKVVHDLRSHEPQRQVEEWHRAMGIYIAKKPSIPPPETVKTRVLLAHGETNELVEALEAGDIEKVADAIADRLFENYGTAISCGLNAKALFDEVVRSNFTKDPPGPDGKARKGTNYSPPNLKPIIEAQLRGEAVDGRPPVEEKVPCWACGQPTEEMKGESLQQCGPCCSVVIQTIRQKGAEALPSGDDEALRAFILKERGIEKSVSGSWKNRVDWAPGRSAVLSDYQPEKKVHAPAQPLAKDEKCPRSVAEVEGELAWEKLRMQTALVPGGGVPWEGLRPSEREAYIRERKVPMWRDDPDYAPANPAAPPEHTHYHEVEPDPRCPDCIIPAPPEKCCCERTDDHLHLKCPVHGFRPGHPGYVPPVVQDDPARATPGATRAEVVVWARSRDEKCPRCGGPGWGWDRSGRRVRCADCGGTGQPSSSRGA
jgi:predicted HAD superfamily Cof-like phosphohydrolase